MNRGFNRLSTIKTIRWTRIEWFHVGLSEEKISVLEIQVYQKRLREWREQRTSSDLLNAIVFNLQDDAVLRVNE